MLLSGHPCHAGTQSCRYWNGKLYVIRSINCMPHFLTLWNSELFFNHLGHNNFSHNPTVGQFNLLSFPHLGSPLAPSLCFFQLNSRLFGSLRCLIMKYLAAGDVLNFLLWSNELVSPPCLILSLFSQHLWKPWPFWRTAIKTPASSSWLVIAHLEPVILHSELKLFSPCMH